MEALAVIAGLAGLIWGVILWSRGGLLAGCLAVLLAGICFSTEFFVVRWGPLPLTVDRVLWLVLIAQYALWRRWGWAEPKSLGKPEWVLCALTAVMIFSTFTADWKELNYRPLSWLILYYLMPFGVYWVARQTPLSQRSLAALLTCLTVFGVYLAVTTLAEFYQLWWLVFPKYIETTAADPASEFVGRGRGPLLQPIGNGILLVACLGATAMWWPRLGRPRHLLLVPLLVLLLAAAATTLTRSVWISTTLAAALLLGLALPRHWRWPALAGGLLLAIAVTVTQWDRLVAFKRDRQLAAEKTEESVYLRPVLMAITWRMFLDRPLLGCGYCQYPREHLNYTSDRSTNLPLEKGRGYIPHNVGFSLLAETGLVGLGCFAALLGLWAAEAWRLWRTTTAPLAVRQQGLLLLIVMIAYAVNGMFHDVSAVPMANMLLYFTAGVTASLRPWISAQPAERGQSLDFSVRRSAGH